MRTVGTLQVREDLLDRYPEVRTPAALEAIDVLAPFDVDRRALMRARLERRRRRQQNREPLTFLPADATIGRTTIDFADARAGRFDGSEIPADLERQWIQ